MSKEQQEEQCGQSQDREEKVVGEEGRVTGGRGTKEVGRLWKAFHVTVRALAFTLSWEVTVVF